jgi:hypothetical protein
MKRAILCEVCKHQACTFNFLLHRKTMMCLVRPGIVAEQVICRKFDEGQTAIDLGNDICRVIDDLLAEAHGVTMDDQQVKIKVEAAR